MGEGRGERAGGGVGGDSPWIRCGQVHVKLQQRLESNVNGLHSRKQRERESTCDHMIFLNLTPPMCLSASPPPSPSLPLSLPSCDLHYQLGMVAKWHSHRDPPRAPQKNLIFKKNYFNYFINIQSINNKSEVVNIIMGKEWWCFQGGNQRVVLVIGIVLEIWCVGHMGLHVIRATHPKPNPSPLSLLLLLLSHSHTTLHLYILLFYTLFIIILINIIN